MKIKVDNQARLQATIDEIQKRSTTRLITAESIRDMLSSIKVPKSRLSGTIVVYDGGESFPRSYGYAPMSTHWTAENRNGLWYIIDIQRGRCPNRKSGHKARVQWSDAAKTWILEQSTYIQ